MDWVSRCGSGDPTAALRIQLTHPALVDEFIQSLGRMGFVAHECGYDTVFVAGDVQRCAVARAQLQLYVQVWQATHPGVSASFRPGSEDGHPSHPHDDSARTNLLKPPL